MHPIDYPDPVVDLKTSYQHAKEQLWRFKSSEGVKRERERILSRHIERRVSQREERFLPPESFAMLAAIRNQ